MQAATASEEIEKQQAEIEFRKGVIKARNETIPSMEKQIRANKPDEVLGSNYLIYGI